MAGFLENFFVCFPFFWAILDEKILIQYAI